MEGRGELGWVEFIVVFTSLAATTSVGLYFSRYGKTSLDEYMYGGKTMTVLPLALSITATFMSGISQTVLAQETYLFGTQAAMACLMFIVSAFVATTFHLPVLHKFKNVSSFQYFDLRFNQHVRKLVSVVFIFEAIQHSAISIYVPSTAFSQATGLPMLKIAFVLTVVCVACSAMGGLKSVAWSDTLQVLVIIFCICCFFVLGISKAGGVMETIDKIQDGGRWEFFNLDLSLYPRYTFWGCVLGKSMTSTVLNLSPAFHQRYVCLPSYQQTKRVVWFGAIVATLTNFVSWMTGTVMYAYFAGCDPVLAKKGIESYNMILPYFVSQVAKDLPGLSGLFHASVMAAGISTATSYWNTVSCAIYEDFIRPKWRFTDKTAYRILILILLIIAALSNVGVFLASGFSNLFEATTAFRGITHALLFVFYNAALFFPWVNAIGVVTGAVTGALVTLTIIIGGIRAQKHGLLRDVPKLLTTRYCNETFNNSTILTVGTTDYGNHKFADPSVFWMFKMSICFYTLFGALIGIVVAVLVSFLTGRQPLNSLNPNLIVPQMRWVLPPKVEEEAKDTVDTPMLKVQSVNQNQHNDAEDYRAT